MPTARAICASRVMDSSTLLVSTIIKSANSSITRSEEHTSELQSRLHLVCRLLLEKKTRHREQRHYSTRLHVAEEGYLVPDVAGDRLIAPADYDVRLDADRSLLADGVLVGLRLQFV